MSALIRITLFLLFSLNLPVLADSPPLEKMPGKTFANVSARAKVEFTTGPIWAMRRTRLRFRFTRRSPVQ